MNVATESLRPLVIRFGAFGDMILMIPALKRLAQRYGAACDVVSSGSWTAPLLQRVPAVNRGWLLTSRRAPFWLNRSQQQLVAALRQRGPGPVYVFEPDDKPLTWLRRAGIGAEWICSFRDLPRATGEHLLDRSLRLAAATPPALLRDARMVDVATKPDARPVLSVEDRGDCEQWLQRARLGSAPLVLIQPGNKKTMKGGRRRRGSNIAYWPEANWATVVGAVLADRREARVVICGTPAESPLAEEIVTRVSADARSRVVNACHELPLIRLIALQERAHSMVSVDTGPAHSAAAMGCPLVVLFSRLSHRSPDLYAPVPTSARVRVLVPEGPALDTPVEQISPERVISAWRDVTR